MENHPHSTEKMVSWRQLESSLPFEKLPELHREFLLWRGVAGAAELGVRRAQQRVEAELNRMVQAGAAQKSEGDWLISWAALDGFAFRPTVKNQPSWKADF